MKVSKTAIFLFELMIVVLIFSVASAVCTSIFGKAADTSRDSKALTMAVIRAESIAEEFKAGVMNTPDRLYDFFHVPGNIVQSYREDSAEQAPDGATVYLDEDWNAVENIHGTVKYAVSVRIAQLNGANQMSIWVNAVSRAADESGMSPYEEVYRLKVKSYGQ